MRKVTTLLVAGLLLSSSALFAQSTEYSLNVAASADINTPFFQGTASGGGVQSGARAIAGPYDLDGDGKHEVLVSDYTGGGRVHVIENAGADTWEWVYSTPVLDSTGTTNNIRAIVGGDLDGDGRGEIMFFAGRSYSATNPNIATLPAGLYLFENTGADDDYGTAPASIYEFNDDLPDRWRTEQMATGDIDGDGFQELMFGNNGANNRYDNWYILSITGDIGSGFETWVEEARLSSRGSEDFDPVNRGGGSAYAIHAGDFDGDGNHDLSLHSWNNFNLTTGTVTGADTYSFPAEGADNAFVRASSADQVSFFGGVVVDINGDGDDEVVYPNLQTGNLSVLNYESGEDVLQVTADNIAFDIIPGVSGLGITAGDLDGDGQVELIGSGFSYGANSFAAGNATQYVRVAEFNAAAGADPEDPANYSAVQSLDITAAYDTLGTNFDFIKRDSAGVLSEYWENTSFTGKDRAGGHPGQGATFVSKLTFLGDPDGDGLNEVALAFQGVDDSTYVIQEVFNPADSTYTRTIEERRVNENRVFMRVISGGGAFGVSIEDERVVLPSDYKLHANYPNPFNPTTTIGFTLPLDKRISVRVFDVTGRLVKTLINDAQFTQGTHEVTWDATNDAGQAVASGTYLYTLEYGNFRQSKTMVLLK